MQLMELLISSAMRNSGLNNVTTDIRHLGPGQSHIARIGFSLATETGLFKLDAHDIRMNYKPEQLLDGRADKLTINRLELYYQGIKNSPGDKAASNSFEPLTIIAALRHGLRKYIIFNSFAAEHINLDGDDFGALQGKPFQLEGRNDNGAVYAEFTLKNSTASGRQDALRQLVITPLSQDILHAELRLSEKTVAVPVKLQLNILDTEVSGNYVIHPGKLQRWLEPFVSVSDISQIKTVKGTLSFNFKSNDKITSIITAATDELVFRDYSADSIVVELTLENPVPDPLRQIRIHNGSTIKADKFSYQNFSIDDSLINMSGELSTADTALDFTGSISAEKLVLQYHSHGLQLNDIAARISISADKMHADGNFSTTTAPAQFRFTMGHDFNLSQGRLSIRPIKPIDLSNENSKLSLLLTPWPYPFDLLSGSIKLSSDATWSQKKDFRLTGRIELVDTGGHYRELVFSGLSLKHELEILPDLRTIRAGKINLQHLDSGVTAANISTVLTLANAASGPLPQLVIKDLYGEIFDGTFTGENFIFDPNKSTNRFKINASDIDLAKIIETQQLEDISVTGRVDGTIPVEINEQGVFIEHGAFLNNVRAGTIRYNPASGTDQLQQNPVTGIALDALRDFRYSHLSADVNFTPEGMLTINLKLKGTSPELNTSRPVHLNINTEQNLLSLLKSLRFAEGISANIDKKVRLQYEKSAGNKQAE